MSLLRQKIEEVSRSLLPVIALVLVLAFTLVNPESDVIIRFLLGSLLLLIGLGIFLLGVDLAMNPIGEHMAAATATSKTAIGVAVLSFLMGFLVTVAEPDLLILGEQVESASGGTIQAQTMVYMVSAGVGVLIMLGTFRLLRGRSYPMFMGLAYMGIFVLSLFVSEEFLAISFDSSGATTGALTTPFILALSAGLSRIKGGKTTEEDAFGMVGVMSAGPMYALMLMSIITGQSNIQGEPAPFEPASGILSPLLHLLPDELIKSFVALLPLCALFFLLNFVRFKLARREMSRILKGLLYTLVGLTLFLTGVYVGFLDMGQILGRSIAANYSWLLPVVAFALGMIVVLVEPAVIVLGQQIEEVTGGRIPNRIIKITLSIGVALAMTGSMLRIMIPEVKLWYFLLTGFAAAIVLSFMSDPVFVGIAYDAGGVASGPMTATFVLAFAQGAAAMTPTANVLVDGFGVIAMVAMAPVLSIMVLGAVFKRKAAVARLEENRPAQQAPILAGKVEFYDCVVAILNRGLAEEAIELARGIGARGATIIHGRGSGGHEVRMFNVELQKEKEAVIWLVDTRISDQVAECLYHGLDLGGEGGGTVFTIPSGAMGLHDIQEDAEQGLSRCQVEQGLQAAQQGLAAGAETEASKGDPSTPSANISDMQTPDNAGE
ncbi:MAG: DUF1538 domain-containing protein [Clostridiales bacterium]|nr:DUF1538 domain-containing protein [Clostridiales bacterium]